MAVAEFTHYVYDRHGRRVPVAMVRNPRGGYDPHHGRGYQRLGLPARACRQCGRKIEDDNTSDTCGRC